LLATTALPNTNPGVVGPKRRLSKASVPASVGAAAWRLAADGHRIRAMSRSSSSDQKIRSIGAEPVRCDLDTVIAANVRGAEIVIHCAAFVEQWGPPDAWDRINVQGTRRTLAAAQQSGGRRFIHIGTEAALEGLAA
jgi:nucleoside-diphosphate-sugar epimerase